MFSLETAKQIYHGKLIGSPQIPLNNPNLSWLCKKCMKHCKHGRHLKSGYKNQHIVAQFVSHTHTHAKKNFPCHTHTHTLTKSVQICKIIATRNLQKWSKKLKEQTYYLVLLSASPTYSLVFSLFFCFQAFQVFHVILFCFYTLSLPFFFVHNTWE